MFRRMKWKIVAVLLCTLFIIGCSNTSMSIEQQNDDVYVMMKGTDLYIKYPDKDAEKVASNIMDGSAHYYDDKGLVFIDNDYNLYLYEDGKKEKIAKNVSDDYNAYNISANNETFAYLSDDGDLYAIFKDKDKIKVASDVSYYTISSDGEYIYYVNEEDELYSFTSEEQKDKIASDVDFYYVSNNGKKIVIYTYEDDLYIRDIEEDDKTKVFSGEEIYRYVHIDDNGDLSYLSDYDYYDGKGELYFKPANGEKIRIASDVTSFQKHDDTFYLLDVDNNLYVKDTDAEQSEKLAVDVQQYFVVGNKVYYVDSDDNLFLNKNGKKEKIGVDVSFGDYLYEVSVIEDNIIFLTKDKELYCNTEKVSANVETYVAYVDRIVYSTTDGALHSVSPKKLDKKKAFENPKSYSSIYYGNQLVYNSTLSAEDIVGVWEIESDYSGGFIEILQNDSSDDFIDLTLYFEGEEDEESACEITDATETTITVDDEVVFTKVSDNKWEISDVGDSDNYLTLTKSSDKNLADYRDKYDSYYDSYYDEEEYY